MLCSLPLVLSPQPFSCSDLLGESARPLQRSQVPASLARSYPPSLLVPELSAACHAALAGRGFGRQGGGAPDEKQEAAEADSAASADDDAAASSDDSKKKKGARWRRSVEPLHPAVPLFLTAFMTLDREGNG